MVEAVDFERRPVGGCDRGVCVETDRVHLHTCRAIESGVLGQVLVQGAARSDVEHLIAAADAERGHLGRDCEPGQFEFERVALGFDRAEIRIGVAAVVCGVDIGAAREDQAIQAADDFFSSYLHRNMYGYSTAVKNSVDVVDQYSID